MRAETVQLSSLGCVHAGPGGAAPDKRAVEEEFKATPHQLVAFDDKGKVAMDAKEKELKLKKGRKLPKRKLKHSTAYQHGKRDGQAIAESGQLGCKKVKAA